MTIKVYELSELCDFQGGYSFKSGDYQATPENAYEVFRMGNIARGGGLNINANHVYINKSKCVGLNKFLLKKNDLVMSMTDMKSSMALLGHTALIPRSDHFILNQRVGRLRVKNDNVVDVRYLYYFTNLDENIQNLRSKANSGVQVNLTTSSILESLIVLPPLPEQRAIAGVLGALDDKIELNRRMNRTLEELARAVFGELMNDECGLMNGEEKTIGEVVTIVGGSTPSTTNPAFWDGGEIHWATPKDLAPLQSPILLDTNSKITGLGLQQIGSGLLPVGTVLLSSRAPIGYLAITQIPVAINQGFIAIKCTDEVPNYFVLNWLKENMEEIIGRANGTTFLEISKSNFRPMKIVLPPAGKMKEFVETVKPFYEKIASNLKESRTLAVLRDGLLPKLMRGEVRVEGAA